MFVLPLNENVALWKLEINCYFLIKFHLLINAVTVAFFQKTALFNYLKVRYLIRSNPFREQDIAKVRANTFRESVILRDSPGTTIFVLKSIVNPHYWTKLYCINQSNSLSAIQTRCVTSTPMFLYIIYISYIPKFHKSNGMLRRPTEGTLVNWMQAIYCSA